ncbi:MAG: hypothetical protein QOJ03_1381, partial [Frankiaceae bacterium]|nr:hypothetical protein [Frankiaceae bacterium]
MARGVASRGRRRRRTLAAVAVAGTALLLPASASTAAPPAGIRLPIPVEGVDPLGGVDLGLRKDRLLKSVVPGPVRDEEDVTVAVGPTGAPADVTDVQRLVINHAGNYIVRELGPARAAVGLGGTLPPVLELGTVVWQGFSPGRRVLAARLTLDAGIEAARLPMRVSLAFTDAGGHHRSLRPGGRAPADGTVTMTLSNNTASNRVVDAGDAEPRALAAVLDRLRRAAARPRASVPPVAGNGLPRVLPGTRIGRRPLEVVAPLRVTGTITVPGGEAAVTGPGTSAVGGGVGLDGTLTGDATFTVAMSRGDRLGLHL